MNRRIVVVEDEPLIRMDAVAMLETAGLDVVEFDHAEDALRYTEANASDIAAVFTDVTLAGDMDGIDLAREVAMADPRILVLVTSARYSERPRNLPDNASYMRKPWLPLAVINTLQTAAEC